MFLDTLLNLPGVIVKYFQVVFNLLAPVNFTTSEYSFFTPILSANQLLSTLTSTQEIYTLSKSFFPSTLERNITTSSEEYSSMSRRQRSSTPVVGYSFKVGDFYPSTTLKFYPSIFRSVSDVTRGVRRASWFYSPSFSTLWKENFGNYMHRVIHTDVFPITELRSRPTTLSNNSTFYNFFYLVSNSNGFINNR